MWQRALGISVVVISVAASACSSSSDGGATQTGGGTAGTGSTSATGSGTTATGRGTTATSAGTTSTAGPTTGTTAGTSAGTTTAGTTSATTATSGTTGSTTAGDAGTTTSLAKGCTTDADCGGALTCLKETDKLIFGQGGPPNGYCTMVCQTADDQTTCAGLGGLCLDLSLNVGDPAEPYCVATCTHGTLPDGSSPPRASKCQGRRDVACEPLAPDPTTGAANPAVCIPTCSQDSDCPNRKCDPHASVCVDTLTQTGTAAGTQCSTNLDAGTDTCTGECLTVGLASYCSQRCVYLELNGCNAPAANMSAAGGYHGICALGSSDADVGDTGFCVQECDTASDCIDKSDPGLSCNMIVAGAIGHGYCTWDAQDAGTTPVDAGRGGG